MEPMVSREMDALSRGKSTATPGCRIAHDVVVNVTIAISAHCDTPPQKIITLSIRFR